MVNGKAGQLLQPCSAAVGEAYPSRPVRYVVPFGAGPTAEQARWLAQRLSVAWGQPVVVENHPGASGALGTAAVAQAAPDGYTLLAANPGPLTVGPSIRAGLGYDPLQDFSPIILLATLASVIAVHPRVPAESIAALVALAQARPGELRFGSPGVGTVGHLAMELFQHAAGVRLSHRPCEGLDEAIPALAAGRFDVLVIPLPEARPLALAGGIRALAVTRRTRSTLWPELPTAEEAGVRGFDSFNWNGVAAPARTPHAIVERVNGEIDRLLGSADGRHYFESRGYEIAGGVPETFGAFIRAEYHKWHNVARMVGVQARGVSAPRWW